MKFKVLVSELYTIEKMIEAESYEEAHKIAEEIESDFPSYNYDYVEAHVEVYSADSPMVRSDA